MERFVVVTLICVRRAVVNDALRHTEIDSCDLSHCLDRLDDIAPTSAEHPNNPADVAGLPVRGSGVIDDLGEGGSVEHAAIFAPASTRRTGRLVGHTPGRGLLRGCELPLPRSPSADLGQRWSTFAGPVTAQTAPGRPHDHVATASDLNGGQTRSADWPHNKPLC